ncbi:Meckelin [Chytridiales sp. JEL 0842]|nr:Meckelin [Chytridiales sp. JEL 0842]
MGALALASQTSSFDRTFCLGCQNPVITNRTVTCSCPPGEYLAMRDTSGVPLATAACTPCPDGSYPNADLSECIKCPDPSKMTAVQVDESGYQCFCNSDMGYSAIPIGNECLNATAVQSQFQDSTVEYPDAIGPEGSPSPISNLPSDFFAKYATWAAAKCSSEWNEEACQVLGNLCVLQMPVSLPWLYYQEQPGVVGNMSPNVSIDLSSPSVKGKLSFVLAAYTPEGKFLGFKSLQDQFEFCRYQASASDSPWFIVGYNYASQCNLNIFNIANILVDDAGQRFPIPIRVLNMAENKALSDRVFDSIAQTRVSYDFTGNVFTRRFFLVDKVSGVSNNTLKVMRVPTHISLWIMKRDDNSGRILTPVMNILYAERNIDGPALATASSLYSLPTYNFSVLYSMDLNYFWRIMQILFSLTTVLAILYGLYLTRNWSKRNMAGPGDSIDTNFLVYSVTNISGQGALYLFLPVSSYDVGLFLTILITAVVTQGFYVGVRIYYQCKTDVFFIDWEKSRGKLLNSSNDASPKPAPVSIWRSIFMANQWNALQTHRRVNIEFLLVWTYFVLEGLDVAFAATPQPIMSDLTPGGRSPILIFAVDSLVILLVVVLQTMFKYLIYDRFYRDRILQYMDLLSVSNVSLIIFDEQCHGYYIHGRSVHQMADTDAAELNANLRKEENDMVPGRGLQDSDKQVFEIFLTSELRATYDKIYGVVVGNQAISKTGRGKHITTLKATSKVKGADLESVKAYETINRFFCTFFDKNLKDFQYMIRDKTYFERYLGATPDTLQGSVFLSDTFAYTWVLLRGIEPAILTFYALLFVFVDVFANSVSVAAVSVYMVDLTLRFCRRHFGEQNISTKTLLDSKFLI